MASRASVADRVATAKDTAEAAMQRIAKSLSIELPPKAFNPRPKDVDITHVLYNERVSSFLVSLADKLEPPAAKPEPVYMDPVLEDPKPAAEAVEPPAESPKAPKATKVQKAAK